MNISRDLGSISYDPKNEGNEPAVPADRPSTVHDLKLQSPYFEDIESGKKRFEIRWDNKNIQRGDVCRLHQWNEVEAKYSGKTITVHVDYVAEFGEVARLFGADAPRFMVFGITVIGAEAPAANNGSNAQVSNVVKAILEHRFSEARINTDHHIAMVTRREVTQLAFLLHDALIIDEVPAEMVKYRKSDEDSEEGGQ